MFVFEVLPQLSWVCLSAKERESICLASVGRSENKLQNLIMYSCLSGPSSWFSHTPRPLSSAAPIVMKFEVAKEQLAAELSKPWGLISSRLYFFGGLWVQLSLRNFGSFDSYSLSHQVSTPHRHCRQR